MYSMGIGKQMSSNFDFEVDSVVLQSFVLLMLLNTFIIKKLGTGMQKAFSQTCLVIFMEL